MNHRFIASLFALVVASTGIIVACSSDDSGSSGGTQASTTTVRVTAAAGGTVADPTGKTKLDIPAGALASDTDITLTILPKSGAAVVDVSEFGPDGLQFLKPVTLTIKGDAALAPQGKTLAVAVNEGADFKAVPGSTFANGTATASITHFSRYTLVVVDGKAILQPPATCDLARSGFTPCGGDPTGTWAFAEFCIPGGELGKLDGCPEFTAAGDFEVKRDAVFDGKNLTITAGSIVSTVTANYPLICFNRDPDGGAPREGGVGDCATLQNEFFTKKGKPGTCVEKPTGTCACTETKTEPQAEQKSTYTISGNTLTTTSADGKTSTSEFCVNGNLLTAKSPDANGKPGQLYVLNKK